MDFWAIPVSYTHLDVYKRQEVLLVGEERAAGHVHGVARDRTDGLVEHVLEGFALYQMCIRDRKLSDAGWLLLPLIP